MTYQEPYPMSEQKDRPKLREKILDILVQNCSLVDNCPKQCTPTDGEICYSHFLKPLEALIEEAKREERERIITKMDHRIESLSIALACEDPIDRMAIRNVIHGWQALKGD